MKKLIPAIFIMFTGCLLLVFACSGGGGGSSSDRTGELSLKMTDATTTDYKALYITVKEVKVCMALLDEDEDESEWITVASPGKTFNLLELVNGVTEQLGLTALEAGRYNQLRLVLDPQPDDELNILGENHPFGNYFIDPSDNMIELKVPSGFESGFKIVGGFTVGEDSTTFIVLDFNVLKSVIQAGNSGDWILKPTVKLLNEDTSAAISGTVIDASTNEALEGVMVSAQIVTEESDTEIISAATVTDETGAYKLLVDPGSYMVVAGMAGYKSAHVEVTVETGDELVQDFSLEPGQGEGTITGLVEILNGEDEQFITINILQKTEDGNVVEVDTQSVANGGQYLFDLPEGVYSMVAIFTVDGEEMTLEANEAFIILDGIVINFDILFENIEEDDDEDDNDDNPDKVTICHKGRTITISYSALNAHLNHGDVEGSCEDADMDGDESEEDCEGTEACDDDQHKVTVCHKGREISIAESAVQAHLNHGDTLGSCNAGDDPQDEDPGDDGSEDPADDTGDDDSGGTGDDV